MQDRYGSMCNVVVADGQGIVKLQMQMLLSLYVDVKVDLWSVDRERDHPIIVNSRTPVIIIIILNRTIPED